MSYRITLTLQSYRYVVVSRAGRVVSCADLLRVVSIVLNISKHFTGITITIQTSRSECRNLGGPGQTKRVSLLPELEKN